MYLLTIEGDREIAASGISLKETAMSSLKKSEGRPIVAVNTCTTS